MLAGPVATRFLAGYGADVLRIDPPDWDEPAIEPEVTLGKRCARLDLRQPPDWARFERLISDADLFIHGYRPEALGALGYGEDIRRALNPSLVDVRLDAYGWSGPWRNRRGFDSLVQMSTGVAAAGRAWRGADKPLPLPLPVQALDHATGYFMAAAAVHALAQRLNKGQATSASLSLARTAALLIGTPRQEIEPKALSPADADYSAAIQVTDWGSAHRALPPVRVAGAPMGWTRPALRLGFGVSGVGMMASSREHSEHDIVRLPPDEERIIVHQALTDHYRNTLDEPIPALGNQMPRKAVKTAKGRKKVIAWLKMLENQSAQQRPEDPMGAYDFTWLWRELGVGDERR